MPIITAMISRPEIDKSRRYLFIALIVVGAFLRLFQLDQYPLGVHQDELSNMYDGWSIATTGHDRFGDPYPGVVRAFGEHDYRPALYPWLAAVSEGIGGFSIVTGRLPAAILGIVSLFLVYGFARERGRAFQKSRRPFVARSHRPGREKRFRGSQPEAGR